jgi:hypothetical protein
MSNSSKNIKSEKKKEIKNSFAVKHSPILQAVP